MNNNVLSKRVLFRGSFLNNAGLLVFFLGLLFLGLVGGAQAAPGDSNADPANIDGNPGDMNITVYPTGTTQDKANLQWAAYNVYPEGKIALRAVNKAGDPTPFNLGIGTTWDGSANIYILKGMTLEGVTGRWGAKPIIQGGFFSFIVMPGYPGFPPGDVTIRNLHFKENGGAAISVSNLAADKQCVIKNNEFTNNLWETFRDGKLPADAPDLVKQKLLFSGGAYYYWSILIGALDAPYNVKGQVIVEGNQVNPEAAGLPDESDWPVDVGYESIGVETLVAAGNVEIKGNGVENCSSGGIWLLGPQGDSLVAHNHVTMGALKSPHPAGTVGIVAGYGLFSGPETEGGSVAIMHNHVETGQDQIAIVLKGSMGKTLSSGHLVQNICTMKNGRYALEITDVTEFNSNGNKVIGTAGYAFRVGNSTPYLFPLDTDNNKIMSLDVTRFEPTSDCHVYFDSDAHDNMLVNPRYDPREPYELACGSLEANRIIVPSRQKHSIFRWHR